MPRKRTEICVSCNESSAQDGRYCHKCRNQKRKKYFQQRYIDNGGYEWHKTRTSEYKIRQKLLKRSDAKCERCGWSEAEEILEIHHRDCNKKNNKLSNLEMLCPTCHKYHHFLEKTGLFHEDKSKYLPITRKPLIPC